MRAGVANYSPLNIFCHPCAHRTNW